MRPTAIDSDSHVMEPADLWRKYVDPKRRDLALSIENTPQSADDLVAQRASLCFRGKPLFSVCGSTPTGLRDMEALASQARTCKASSTVRERFVDIRDAVLSYSDQTPASGYDAGERLRWMKTMNIDRAVILPTWGAMWERYLDDQPEAVSANMAAYNRWMLEFCSVDRKRLIGIGQLSLNNLEWTLAEMTLLAKAGIRAVQLRPVLHHGHPLSHRAFDRFWAAVVDLNLGVYFHVSGMGSGTRDFFDAGWYEGEDRGQHNGVIWGVSTHVPLMLTLTAMVRDNFFDRHPSVRLCSAEHGYRWVGPWLTELDARWHLMIARGFVRHSKRFEMPSQAVRNHVWFAGIHDELRDAKRDDMLDRVMFGSDFPHPECESNPLDSFLAHARGMSSRQRSRLLSENCEDFLGE